MARTADRLIVCSEFMGGHISTVFAVPRARYTVIPNGIDVDKLRPSAATPSRPARPGEQEYGETRETRNPGRTGKTGETGKTRETESDFAFRGRFAQPEERLVLMVGRLVHEKGFHVALDALAPVIWPSSAGCRFVVAGAGMAQAELELSGSPSRPRRATGTFLGWVGDEMLRALYRVADPVRRPVDLRAVWPRRARGDGVWLSVRRRRHRRLAGGGAGHDGPRFPEQDTAALAAILERLLTDDATRKRLAARGQAHVLRFDWAQVARETLTLTQRSLAARTPAPDEADVHRGRVPPRVL